LNRWQKFWYGPEDAGAWLREVIARKIAIKSWLERVENGTLLSRPVSLPELFRPRTFLNAMRQQTARTTGKAIDSLKLTCSWSAVLLPKSAAVKVQVLSRALSSPTVVFPLI
jgi:dynein heavy chain 2